MNKGKEGALGEALHLYWKNSALTPLPSQCALVVVWDTRLVLIQRQVVCSESAGPAQHLPVFIYFPFVSNHCFASVADRLKSCWSWYIADGYIHFDFLDGEKCCGGHDLVGLKMLKVIVPNAGGIRLCKLPRFFGANDPEGTIGFYVDKSSGHNAVVHKFEGPPTQLYAGYIGDGVCSTPVDFHIHNDFLDLGKAVRLIQADQVTAEHSHSHAHHLSRTKMPV